MSSNSKPANPAKKSCGGSCGCSCKSVTPEQIRVRAFEIYTARKGAPGNAAADWLQAERELQAGALPAAKATAPTPVRERVTVRTA
jgi:hypothetical protein